jgi:glycosyltransferase A (GT-A) superfamily protein (DUF2064 family)
MVKEPVVGRVKTRLAREVGAVRATSFYRAASTAVLAQVFAAAPGDRADVTPTGQSPARQPRAFAPRAGSGDLGQRMQRDGQRAARARRRHRHGCSVDQIRHIQAALKALGSHDAVFGPSPDGGYWLVGLKRRPRIPRAFTSITWSSRDALEQTLSNLSGLTVARVATLPDVDEAHDLVSARSVV